MVQQRPPSDLIARFRQVESPGGHSFRPMEAVVEGERIVFRQGRGCAYVALGLVILFSAIFVPLMTLGLVQSVSLPLGLVAGAVLCLILGSLMVDIVRRQAHRVHFVIDAATRTIEIWNRGHKGESYSIGDVKAFLGYQSLNADTAWNSLSIVLTDDRVVQIAGDLGSTANLERHLKVIGYTCDVLALYVSELPDLDQLMLRTFPYRVADVTKLLAASKVVYDPGSMG